MNQKKLEEVTSQLLSAAQKIRSKKGPAYALGDEDVLKNFKHLGKMLDVSPLLIWAIYMTKHYTAIISYAKNSEIPQSESIEERFSDMLNYLFMGYGLLTDKREEHDYIYNYSKDGHTTAM